MSIASHPFEIVDSQNDFPPHQRYSTLERASRELRKAVPEGRFFIRDRRTKERLAPCGAVFMAERTGDPDCGCGWGELCDRT